MAIYSVNVISSSKLKRCMRSVVVKDYFSLTSLYFNTLAEKPHIGKLANKRWISWNKRLRYNMNTIGKRIVHTCQRNFRHSSN